MNKLIENWTTKLEQKKGQKYQLEKEIDSLKIRKKQLNKELIFQEKAREILRLVGLKTQEQLQYHISDITSLAMESIFNNPYSVELEFVQRRNKTECDIWFVRDGHKFNPLEDNGGGTVDVAAFALRISCWALNRPRFNNTIILDEPLKWISEKYKPACAEMLKQISSQLGIQIIMVTHERIFTEKADKVIEIGINNEVSFIKKGKD